MNIFSRFLSQFRSDPSLEAFLERWDRLEALVLRVYRRESASEDDLAEYIELRAWLMEAYPAWEERLAEYWPQTLVGGEPAENDPFLFLLAPERASAFVANWRALQTLPAARESLNRLLQT